MDEIELRNFSNNTPMAKGGLPPNAVRPVLLVLLSLFKFL